MVHIFIGLGWTKMYGIFAFFYLPNWTTKQIVLDFMPVYIFIVYLRIADLRYNFFIIN